MRHHYILAIDPANVESGWVVIDCDDYRPLAFGKTNNEDFRDMIYSGDFGDVKLWGEDEVIPAIEMVASYGMPVGREVFETCVWIGRFEEALLKARHGYSRLYTDPEFIFRKDVKMNICGRTSAKDANIRQALIDRFASTPSGQGTKKNPDWFYGFKADMWAAYATGTYCLDKIKEGLL